MHFEVAYAIHDDNVPVLVSPADAVAVDFPDVCDARWGEIVLAMKDLVLGTSV